MSSRCQRLVRSAPILARHLRRHIVAYVALCFALVGSAWAVTPASSTLGALNFTLANYQSLHLTQDLSAAQTSKQVPLPADGTWHTILSSSQRNSSLSPALTMFNAAITAENQGAKASTLEMLCAERGVAAEEVVAFGDMPNDLPMLAWAGASYAMAGAHPSVRELADDTAPGNDEDGVAVVLERLFGL